MPRRLLELCFLCAIASAGNDACVDGKAFSSSKSNTSCSCDRNDANASAGPKPRCLLHSDERRVVPYFLEPDSEKPLPVKAMEDLYFFETENAAVAIAHGSCPSGFARGIRELPDPGFYKYSPSYLSPGLIQFMGCEQVRRCPPGYYCSRGGLSPPLACGKGVLCNESGLVTPRPCPAGFYCPTSLVALECFQGSFCPERSMVPRSCRKGFYCPNPCSEHKCPSGHWCPEASHQPRKCSWWNRCAEGSGSVNWYRLGLSLAICGPVLFEVALRFIFKQPVHEQTAFKSLQGMTLPCLILLCTTLMMAWLLMPWVALAKSSLLVYTMASVATPHRLKMLRFVLVGAGALFVSVVQGVLAAVWLIYVPICLFAGFLFAAPNLSYQKRGFNALCCLSMSFLMADAFLFLAGVSFSAEEEKNVTIAQGCLAIGHLWLLFAAVLVLFYTEITRQQNLQAHEAFLVEVEMTEGNTPESGRRSIRGSVGIAFQLQDVGLTVRSSKNTVLKDISLEIAADSSCALMGPSGSGKSSLLNVLTGRALHYGEVSGTITANNEAIPEGLESNLKTKNASGFVPQDDVMHTELTVYENVYFSARLRLPPNTGLVDTAARVETVLKDVGIAHVKDTVVGNAEVRGISGGQRKRTSIAMELVGDPSVLFLDEPTSGLDAAAAHSIVKLICNKSSLRCTTVAVIHQPRWQTLECFDQVVLLATGGFLVYSGAVAESVNYFTQVLHAEIPDKANPADCFLDFIDSSSSESSEASHDLAAQWRSNAHSVAPFRSAEEVQAPPPLSSYEKFRPGVSETFWTLYLRCCLQVCRLWKHRVTNLGLVALFLVVVRLLLGDDGDFETILTKMGIAQSMLMLPVCIHSMYVFSCDRLERQREDTAGIPILSQYLAKDLCHFAEMLLFAMLWTGIYGPFSHVAAAPWVLLRLSVAQCYLAFGISFFLSMNLPSQSTATVTIMLLLVVAQLCSGVDMIAYGNVHGALGGLGWVIFMLSPSFYTVERILPILLNDGCTEPLRRAVCDGVLQKKGVSCEVPPNHLRSNGLFGKLLGEPIFLEDMKSSYIFLASDIQLVMFGVALRAITLFQLLLRAGHNGDLSHRIICRVALPLVAIFLIFTIPLTSNSSDAGWLAP